MLDSKVKSPSTNFISAVLVPQVTTFVASSEVGDGRMEDRSDRDHKSGIRVKECLDRTETRIGNE